MHRIMFKSLLIKVYLNLIAIRFLNYKINEICDYAINVINRNL